MKPPKRIIITTGDIDGIGLEIAIKALNSIGPKKNVRFYMIASPRSLSLIKSKLGGTFKIVVSKNLLSAASSITLSDELIVVITSRSPARCVEDAADLCFKGAFEGLVTGPLSKTEIRRSGLKDRGHTEIFRRLNSSRPTFMAFEGSKFSVLLTTDHIPLKDVPTLSVRNLENSAVAAWDYVRTRGDSRPIALLGLNPHCGEDGVIGLDEKIFFKKIVASLKRKKVPVLGPLVPDISFQKEVWKDISIYVCPYHDQGLIPFKSLHKRGQGVHFTVGLPFVRTSVDHGTAKEIAGKWIANHRPMQLAIEKCISMISTRKDIHHV